MRRRGFVMVAVVVVVAAAILVATGAIFAARGATVSARAAELERRLRDAALDGVALAADRLGTDRARLLAGADPEDDAELFTVRDAARQIEVRLVPQWGGEPFSSEAAKIDVNLASPEALARLADGLGDASGALLAGLAASRPISSVDALAARRGTTELLEKVLGPLRMVGEERERYEDEGAATRRRDLAPPLVELLTAHGAEPLVDEAGDPKLDLVAAVGEGVAQRAEASLAEFDDAERDALEEAARAEPDQPLDDGAIARALLARGIGAERIEAILAACTLESGGHGVPRLDIVRADRRVLASLEGIGPDLAARIVDLRDSLDEAERRGTAWLVTRRVMTPEQYAAVVGRITHRSALWRFRVEAQVGVPEDAREGVEPAEPKAAAAFDCIVDVSTERPRIVFLRDVSLLPTARAIAFIGASDERVDEPVDRAADRSDDAPATEPSVERTRPASGAFDFRAPAATIDDAPVPAPERPTIAPAGRDVPKSR